MTTAELENIRSEAHDGAHRLVREVDALLEKLRELHRDSPEAETHLGHHLLIGVEPQLRVARLALENARDGAF